MPTKKSVSDIKANLLAPALTSHFEVEIGVPSGLGNVLGTNKDKLQLMCSDTVLPGSQLTTLETYNDYTGVTERHAYRRQFDQTVELTFYVDAEKYLPIKFFERWISFIMNEEEDDMADYNYNYRVRYPDGKGDGRSTGGYTATGLKVKKFEKDYNNNLEYEFIKSYPLAITSMPVNYDASSLLKCSVQMTYIRYIVKGLDSLTPSRGGGIFNPFQQSVFNAGGILDTIADFAGNAVKDSFGRTGSGTREDPWIRPAIPQ